MLQKKVGTLIGSILVASGSSASINLADGAAIGVFSTVGQGTYYINLGVSASQIAAGVEFLVDVSAAASALGGTIESFAVLGLASGSGLSWNYTEFLYVDVGGGLVFTDDSASSTSNIELANTVNSIQNVLNFANLGHNSEASIADFDNNSSVSDYLVSVYYSGLVLNAYTLSNSTMAQFVGSAICLEGNHLVRQSAGCGSVTPPDVSFSSPTDGTIFTAGTLITVTVSAVDNAGINYCSLSLNGSFLSQDSIAPYEFTDPALDGLAAGSHTLNATCVDIEGYSASAEAAFYVDNPATITGDFSGTINQGENVNGVVIASDPDGLTDGSYFFVTTAPDYGSASIDPAAGLWVYTADLLYLGVDEFAVTVTDDLGFTYDQVISITTIGVDSDGDGLYDGFETFYGFDPLTPGEEGLDGDDDDLTNLEEQANGTNPTLIDTDSDGFSDWIEVTFSSNPNNPDQNPLQKKYVGSDSLSYDSFGESVNVDGDTAIVGAPYEDSGGNRSGAAYIFERINGDWVETQKLVASDAGEFNDFGFKVAIDGDTAAVTAEGGNNFKGAVYIFNRIDGEWIEQQKLFSSNVSDYDFGYSLALEDDTLVISAPRVDALSSVSRAAYVFTRNNGVWSEEQTLLPGGNPYAFGASIALDGDKLLVGAPRESHSGFGLAGAAYIFSKSSAVWLEQQRLIASDPDALDGFGWSVALDGDTAMIGAYRENSVDFDAGAVYVFSQSGGIWNEQQKLTASDGGSSDRFGGNVALDEGLAVISSTSRDTIYVFSQSGANWIERQKYTGNNGPHLTGFGDSVGLSDNIAVVGVRHEIPPVQRSPGAIYIFDFDADKDGLWNFVETSSGTYISPDDTGTDPLDADSDDDSLFDGFEVLYGFNPHNVGEAGLDSDGDGLTNQEEQALDTNPNLVDSDGDGADDGLEVQSGTGPLDPDSVPELNIPIPVGAAFMLLVLMVLVRSRFTNVFV